MRKSKGNPWLMNIIWLAGLVVVIFGHDYLDKNVLWRLTTPDDAILYAWLQFALPFLTGIYMSLVFVWSNFKMRDMSLFFIVALPTLIIAVLLPVMATFSIPLPEPVYWFVNVMNAGQYLPLVAGLTLIPSRSW